MCFGGKSKSTPPPASPTVFQYGPADSSNGQQQQAALVEAQGGKPPVFGSDLGTSASTTGGTSGAAAPATQGAM